MSDSSGRLRGFALAIPLIMGGLHGAVSAQESRPPTNPPATATSINLASLTASQQGAALAALQQLSTATGASLNQLAQAAGVTLPASLVGTTPPTTTVDLGGLTADQLTSAQSALRQLSTATGVSVTQLGTIFGIQTTSTNTNPNTTTPNTNPNQSTTNNTSTNNQAGNNQSGNTQAGNNQGQTTNTQTLTTNATGFPPFSLPKVGGAVMPEFCIDFLIGRTLDTVIYLEEEYGLEYPTALARYQFFSDRFDDYARFYFGAAYESPGVNFWIVRDYLINNMD